MATVYIFGVCYDDELMMCSTVGDTCLVTLIDKACRLLLPPGSSLTTTTLK